jgi:predicted nucleic acid-binding protein
LPTSLGTPKDRSRIIVSNTTPISELAKIGQFALLFEVYGHLVVPPEVDRELIAGTHPATAAVPVAEWIEVQPVSDLQQVRALHRATRLGLGECAAILLAAELGAHRLLIDDRAARQEAQRRGLPLIGTIGTLLLAKQRGLIPNLKEVLDELIAHGTRISPALYQTALAAAQEL